MDNFAGILAGLYFEERFQKANLSENESGNPNEELYDLLTNCFVCIPFYPESQPTPEEANWNWESIQNLKFAWLKRQTIMTFNLNSLETPFCSHFLPNKESQEIHLRSLLKEIIQDIQKKKKKDNVLIFGNSDNDFGSKTQNSLVKSFLSTRRWEELLKRTNPCLLRMLFVNCILVWRQKSCLQDQISPNKSKNSENPPQIDINLSKQEKNEGCFFQVAGDRLTKFYFQSRDPNGSKPNERNCRILKTVQNFAHERQSKIYLLVEQVKKFVLAKKKEQEAKDKEKEKEEAKNPPIGNEKNIQKERKQYKMGIEFQNIFQQKKSGSIDFSWLSKLSNRIIPSKFQLYCVDTIQKLENGLPHWSILNVIDTTPANDQMDRFFLSIFYGVCDFERITQTQLSWNEKLPFFKQNVEGKNETGLMKFERWVFHSLKDNKAIVIPKYFKGAVELLTKIKKNQLKNHKKFIEIFKSLMVQYKKTITEKKKEEEKETIEKPEAIKKQIVNKNEKTAACIDPENEQKIHPSNCDNERIEKNDTSVEKEEEANKFLTKFRAIFEDDPGYFTQTESDNDNSVDEESSASSRKLSLGNSPENLQKKDNQSSSNITKQTPSPELQKNLANTEKNKQIMKTINIEIMSENTDKSFSKIFQPNIFISSNSSSCSSSSSSINLSRIISMYNENKIDSSKNNVEHPKNQTSDKTDQKKPKKPKKKKKIGTENDNSDYPDSVPNSLIAKFVIVCMNYLLPPESFGSEANKFIFHQKIMKFFSMNVSDTVSLTTFCENFKLHDIKWIVPVSKKRDSLLKKKRFLDEFINFLFCGIIIPLVGGFFYVTECSQRNRMLYFFKDTWLEIATKGWENLMGNQNEKNLSTENDSVYKPLQDKKIEQMNNWFSNPNVFSAMSGDQKKEKTNSSKSSTTDSFQMRYFPPGIGRLLPKEVSKSKNTQKEKEKEYLPEKMEIDDQSQESDEIIIVENGIEQRFGRENDKAKIDEENTEKPFIEQQKRLRPIVNMKKQIPAERIIKIFSPRNEKAAELKKKVENLIEKKNQGTPANNTTKQSQISQNCFSSTNSLISSSFEALKIENLLRKSELLGSTVTSHPEIYKKLLPFYKEYHSLKKYFKSLHSLENSSNSSSSSSSSSPNSSNSSSDSKNNSIRLYFVGLDVTGAFDSIPHSKISSILDGIFPIGSPKEYVFHKYITLSPKFGSVSYTTKIFTERAKSSNLNTLKNHIDMNDEKFQKKHKSSVVIDLGQSWSKKSETVLQEIKNHVQNCIVVAKVPRKVFPKTKVPENDENTKLQHPHFTLETKILHQTKGIPQGSTLSPLLCNYVYADLEKRFLKQFPGCFGYEHHPKDPLHSFSYYSENNRFSLLNSSQTAIEGLEKILELKNKPSTSNEINLTSNSLLLQEKRTEKMEIEEEKENVSENIFSPSPDLLPQDKKMSQISDSLDNSREIPLFSTPKVKSSNFPGFMVPSPSPITKPQPIPNEIMQLQPNPLILSVPDNVENNANSSSNSSNKSSNSNEKKAQMQESLSIGVLVRLLDDFLYITTSKSFAKQFLQRMSESFKQEYGIEINEKKTKLNFSILDENSPNSDSNVKKTINWCGMIFDGEKYEIKNDYTIYFGKKIPIAFTHKQPGVEILKRIKMSIFNQLREVLLDNTINSFKTICTNVYELALISAIRFHSSLKKLPVKPFQKINYLVSCIVEISDYFSVQFQQKRSRIVQFGSSCPLTLWELHWLVFSAFWTILGKRKQGAYNKTFLQVLKLSRKTIWGKLTKQRIVKKQQRKADMLDVVRDKHHKEILYSIIY